MKRLIFVTVLLFTLYSTSKGQCLKIPYFQIKLMIAADNANSLDTFFISDFFAYKLKIDCLRTPDDQLFSVYRIKKPVYFTIGHEEDSIGVGSLIFHGSDTSSYIFVQFKEGDIYCLQGSVRLDIEAFYVRFFLNTTRNRLTNKELGDMMSSLYIEGLDMHVFFNRIKAVHNRMSRNNSSNNNNFNELIHR